MKKLIAIFITLNLCSGLGASDIFTSFLSKLDSLRVTFDYSFELKGSVPFEGRGSALMQGDSYYLETDGLRIWSNGSVRCIADDVAKELYLENVIKEDFNTNPMMVLKNIDRESVFESASVVFNGRRAQSFTIHSFDADKFKSIIVFFSGGKIAGVEFVDIGGVRSLFKITNLMFHNDKFPASAFSCEFSEFENYQIIDMLSD